VRTPEVWDSLLFDAADLATTPAHDAALICGVLR
jgi:hypothetical protein